MSGFSEAFIVDAVRTPVGRKGGGLAAVHPADLGAHAIRELVERTGIDPAAVEDVVFGCVDTIGPQAGDIARTCWLAAGLPDEVPGTTVDRQCGSSQQAVHFAAQAVMSGTSDLIVAGGVQNMSMIPISSAMLAAEPLGFENPFAGSKGWEARYGTQEVSQFRAAEMIAEKWNITRDDMEAFALESHRRAARGPGRRTLRPGDRAVRRRDARRGRPARHEPRADGQAPHVGRRWPPHRGGVLPDLGRGRGDPRGLGRRGAGARVDAPGTHPPSLGAGCGSDLDADRADPRDRVRALEERHEPRRHRPGRDQRGVRVGRARVAEGSRVRPRAGERQRRRDRARAPVRCDRRRG